MDIRIIGRDVQIDTVETLAVENDNKTETANFILDRYTEGGVDLWTMNGFLVYLNDLGVRFEILDSNLVEDKIHAKWIVTRALTTVNGRFSFCLTFLNADTYDGLPNAEKVWSTNVAQSNISGSLVGENYAVPEEPIILQMLQIASQIVIDGKTSKENADRAETALQATAIAKGSAEDAAKRASDSAVAINEKFEVVQNQIDLSQTLMNQAQALIDQEQILIGQLSAIADRINGEVI